METILHAVFNSEAEARQGRSALEVLADNDTISLGETFIMSRSSFGGTPIIQSARGEHSGSSTLGGGVIGGLLGLLGGPVGVVLGASIGMMVGAPGDIMKSDDIDTYLHRAAQLVPAGKTMLVAHVWEPSPVAVDAALQNFQTHVFRVDVLQALAEADARDWAAVNREIAQTEQSWRDSAAADKAAWQAKLTEIRTSLDQRKRKRADERIAKQEERLAELRAERQHL